MSSNDWSKLCYPIAKILVALRDPVAWYLVAKAIFKQSLAFQQENLLRTKLYFARRERLKIQIWTSSYHSYLFF